MRRRLPHTGVSASMRVTPIWCVRRQTQSGLAPIEWPTTAKLLPPRCEPAAARPPQWYRLSNAPLIAFEAAVPRQSMKAKLNSAGPNPASMGSKTRAIVEPAVQDYACTVLDVDPMTNCHRILRVNFFLTNRRMPGPVKGSSNCLNRKSVPKAPYHLAHSGRGARRRSLTVCASRPGNQRHPPIQRRPQSPCAVFGRLSVEFVVGRVRRRWASDQTFPPLNSPASFRDSVHPTIRCGVGHHNGYGSLCRATKAYSDNVASLAGGSPILARCLYKHSIVGRSGSTPSSTVDIDGKPLENDRWRLGNPCCA